MMDFYNFTWKQKTYFEEKFIKRTGIHVALHFIVKTDQQNLKPSIFSYLEEPNVRKSFNIIVY